MQSPSAGGLVTVGGEGPKVDGIVFDTPSTTKTVVAVVDPGRGPVFRTVHPRTLTERTAQSTDDRALRLLIRRTPPPAPHAARAARTAPRRARAAPAPPPRAPAGARRRPRWLGRRARTLGPRPRGDAP